MNCGDSHFSSHTAQRWSLFTQHSCLESQLNIHTQLSISNRFKPLNICLFVHRDDSLSGLTCLPGSCSSTMLTGLIAIYPDKLPFAFYLMHSTSVGEVGECVPRINVRVWHEISVESCNPEGKAWTSLSFSLSRLKHRSPQCKIALYYGLLFKYCSNAYEFCLRNRFGSKFLLNE